MLEYAYQSATICLVSTTAIFRLPFAVNVIYLLKKDVVNPVLPRNVIIGDFRVPKTLNFKTRLSANLSLNEFYLHENKKIYLLPMASPLDSLWNRGLRQLGNSLSSSHCEPTFQAKLSGFCFIHLQESLAKEKFEPKFKTKGRSSSKKQHLRKKGHQEETKRVRKWFLKVQNNGLIRLEWFSAPK